MSAEGLPLARSGRHALEGATRAAKEDRTIINAHLEGEMRTNYKTKTHVVTQVDVLAEKAVMSILQEEFPGFGILAEESGRTAADSPYTWVVDPLDGTRNYIYGIPHFCVSLALANQDEIVLGIT